MRALVSTSGAAAPTLSLAEVVLQNSIERRHALERNDLLLLAETQYYAAACSSSVSLQEMRALYAALAPLARSMLQPQAPNGEQLTAHACFFALVSALERGKLSAETADALLNDDMLPAPELKPLSASLRLGLALSKETGSEEVFRIACDGNAFAFLLSLMQQQVSSHALRPLHLLTLRHLSSCACETCILSPRMS